MLAGEARSGFARSVLTPLPGSSRGWGFVLVTRERVTPIALFLRQNRIVGRTLSVHECLFETDTHQVRVPVNTDV